MTRLWNPRIGLPLGEREVQLQRCVLRPRGLQPRATTPSSSAQGIYSFKDFTDQAAVKGRHAPVPDLQGNRCARLPYKLDIRRKKCNLIFLANSASKGRREGRPLSRQCLWLKRGVIPAKVRRDRCLQVVSDTSWSHQGVLRKA